MEPTAHIDFIAASYAAATLVVGCLIVWVAADFRLQQRKLAELEMQGITRRSAAAPTSPADRPADSASEQAKA